MSNTHEGATMLHSEDILKVTSSFELQPTKCVSLRECVSVQIFV